MTDELRRDMDGSREGLVGADGPPDGPGLGVDSVGVFAPGGGDDPPADIRLSRVDCRETSGDRWCGAGSDRVLLRIDKSSGMTGGQREPASTMGLIK